jgi:hypothetical protein
MAARLAELRAKRVSAQHLPVSTTQTQSHGGALFPTTTVSTGRVDIVDWLNAFRPGYGKFAAPFVECGYADMEMLCDIQVSHNDALGLFQVVGAKPPQALMMARALESVGAISDDAPRVTVLLRCHGPRQWLESVKEGYDRFAPAFAAAGYEDLEDIVVSLPLSLSLTLSPSL